MVKVPQFEDGHTTFGNDFTDADARRMRDKLVNLKPLTLEDKLINLLNAIDRKIVERRTKKKLKNK